MWWTGKVNPELVQKMYELIEKEWGPEVAAATRAHNEKYGNKFTHYDLYEIADAIRQFGRLPKSKFDIDLFTPKFGYKRLREIKKAFENGLSLEQVKFLANPDFTAEEMEEIRQHLRWVPFNLVKQYIPKIKVPSILREIRTAIFSEPKVDLKELLSYILKFRTLRAWQVNRVAKVLAYGYDKSIIDEIAKATPDQIGYIDGLLFDAYQEKKYGKKAKK